MLDSLLNQTARDYGVSTDISPRTSIKTFEDGADADFQRILDNAEANRQEYQREMSRDAEDRAAERRKDHDRESLRQKERKADAAEASEAEAGADGQAAEAAKPEENAYKFKARRPRGRSLSYATLQADMQLPGGFKRQVSNSLLLTGVSENGLNGLKLSDGETPVSILKGALESMNTSSDLASLDGEAVGPVAALLLQSGVSPEESERLLENLVGEDGRIKMTDLIKVLTQAEDWLQVNGAQDGSLGGLTATGDGLNSLGQFLMGLGLSAETVKAVTSDMEIGAIIQVSTLQEIVSGGGAANLQTMLSEGDLNFLALALQSMGASPEAMGNLGMLLEENRGAVSLGGLLDFLKTLEKPQTQIDVSQTLSNIQDVVLKVESASEVAKAPVFNEILLKLSLLGDRELDRNFFELSPALQALRGGISGIRGDAAGSQGDFNNNGGHNREDRREREERRLMGATMTQGTGSTAVAGAFSGSVYDDVAGYSSQDSLAKQLGQKLLYSARRGVRRLKMNLNPESLGKLSIELKVTGNKLTANIQAESLEAYKALEKEVMALKESLGAEGIELKLTLGYSGTGGGESFEGGDESWLNVGRSGSDGEEENSQKDGQDGYLETGGGLLNTLV